MMTAKSATKRPAVTLTELSVVLAVIAIMIAILLPAIQQIRSAAYLAQSANIYRQYIIATQQFADSHSGTLPSFDAKPPNQGETIFSTLSPYLESSSYEVTNRRLRFVMNDPSLSLHHPDANNHNIGDQRTNITFNPLVYKAGMVLPHSISDGLANTISVTQHYATCNKTYIVPLAIVVCKDKSQVMPCPIDTEIHANTFADNRFISDVVPVTTLINGQAVTRGSYPLTFQDRPTVHDCNPGIPQSTFRGGLLCAFLDGSVRLLSPKISESAFWAAVTPASGERIGTN
jgi:type II secretory pathway pseudopilin PulG